MSRDRVDFAALAADEALIARVSAASAPEQLPTELERLLVEWRAICRNPRAPQQRPLLHQP
ncbi:MAG TPA: hypothetical protein VFO16_22100 [Pseudonocardiaceae bacterium]|nr:hypothetical protein [Pseudonocardiaceae bacterium]